MAAIYMHVGSAIIMQMKISYTLLRGQTTQVREVIANILATQMICFTFIGCFFLVKNEQITKDKVKMSKAIKRYKIIIRGS